MDAYMITFRVVHIVSAILWAGGALFFAGFVGPTIAAMGPDGGRFFGHLVVQRRAVVFFVTVSTLTVVAGGFLYWRDSAGLDPDFFQTGFGAGLTVGAVAGLIAWFTVLLVLAPTSYRITALGGRIASAGAPPAGEQTASMQALQSRLRAFSLFTVVMLMVAAAAMAAAQYIVL